MIREPKLKLQNGLQIYEVQLVGGPYDGSKALCSHNTVWKRDTLYLRGDDDRYYYQPPKEEAESVSKN